MTDSSGLSLTGKLVFRLSGAAILAGAAWVFWQVGVGDWIFFRLVAANFAGGAVICLVQALWHFVQLLRHLSRLGRFKRKGAAPKADRMASAQDLDESGLLK